jgi:hypothetical protein
MHEFDNFVLNLKASFDKETKITRNMEYNQLSTATRREKLKGDFEKFSKIKKTSTNLPLKVYDDSSYKRLQYCRYADD